MKVFNFLVTFLAMILLGCQGESDKLSPEYYVVRNVPKFNEKTVDSTELIEVPPPPMLYYGDHNFVLLDTNRVFYHTKHIYRFCGMGIDHTKPPRLYLETNELVEIKLSELEFFLNNHIRDSISEKEYVNSCISSLQDTIRNAAIRIIINHFKVKGILRYNIRNWTEEEKYALEAKLKNEQYNSREAKFTIGFDNDPRESLELE